MTTEDPRDEIAKLPPRVVDRVRYEPATGCLVWTLSLREGYGQISVDGRILALHRMVWEYLNGPIPAGMMVLHSCDNRPCCRPSHLRVGTPRENMVDMVERRRVRGAPGANAAKTHCVHGHEFTVANTIVTPTGRRQCRECGRRLGRERHSRKRAAQSGALS